MAKRIAVVISQSPSKNPAKRKLEEDIVMGLMLESGIDVTVVPNLYDIKPDSTSLLAMKGITGNLVVCSWLYERATHWVLDRNDIRGQIGQVLLQYDGDDGDDEEPQDLPDEKDRVIDSREIPNRKVYALDLRISNQATDFIDEIKRIKAENAVKVVGLGDITGAVSSLPVVPSANNGTNETTPTNGANSSNGTSGSLGGNGSVENGSSNGSNGHSNIGESIVNRIEEVGGRRWYPVIDYSRCTNCMECIDFCLFGVYGVDRIDTILVEQPDNCRKGCPACSRVCPENAIMFPQHKTPAIAGSTDAAASMKIDLSQLFGAPASGKSAAEIAVLERDEQLVAAGRDAVGTNVGLAKRHTGKPDEPKDDLDSLVDELNDLDI